MTKCRPEASGAGAVVSVLEESLHGRAIEFQCAPIRIARRNRRVVEFNSALLRSSRRQFEDCPQRSTEADVDAASQDRCRSASRAAHRLRQLCIDQHIDGVGWRPKRILRQFLRGRFAKPTHPAIIGISASQERVHLLYVQALDALTPFGERAALLRSLAEWLLLHIEQRKKRAHHCNRRDLPDQWV
jgi:hypothetical protein